jgi:hypothetical protein
LRAQLQHSSAARSINQTQSNCLHGETNQIGTECPEPLGVFDFALGGQDGDGGGLVAALQVATAPLPVLARVAELGVVGDAGDAAAGLLHAYVLLGNVLLEERKEPAEPAALLTKQVAL